MCFNFKKLKQDYQKYKKPSLCLPLRLLDFIWRKRYKPFLFILALIGIIFIFLIEIILHMLNINIANITFGDKIQNSILFLTAIIVFWYTRETFDLKKISQKQYTTNIRPYLALQWEEGKNTLVIKNIGQGVAVDLKFQYFGSSNEIKFNNVPALSIGGHTRSFVSNEIDQINTLKPTEKNIYQIIVNYKNIEEKHYYAKFKTNLGYNDKFEILEQREC